MSTEFRVFYHNTTHMNVLKLLLPAGFFKNRRMFDLDGCIKLGDINGLYPQPQK